MNKGLQFSASQLQKIFPFLFTRRLGKPPVVGTHASKLLFLPFCILCLITVTDHTFRACSMAQASAMQNGGCNFTLLIESWPHNHACTFHNETFENCARHRTRVLHQGPRRVNRSRVGAYNNAELGWYDNGLRGRRRDACGRRSKRCAGSTSRCTHGSSRRP